MSSFKVMLLNFVIAIVLGGCNVSSNGYVNTTNDNSNAYQLSNQVKSLEQNYKILPGISIGNVQLGYNFDEIAKVLGKPFQDGSHDFQGCKYRVAMWYIPDHNGNGSILEVIFSFDNRSVHLKIEGVDFTTPEGIASEDELDLVKKQYIDTSNIKSFVDFSLKSNSKFVEGYSAYWVDKNKGIAFEFYRSHRDKKWRVKSITVLKVGETFVRGYYCNIVEDKYWVELPNLDLEIATKEQ